MKLMTLSRCRHYDSALFMYKALNGHYPEYIRNKFHFIHLEEVGMRAIANDDLSQPNCRLKIAGNAMSVHGPAIWNSIPVQTRDCPTVNTFKTFYFCIHGFL